MPKKFNKIYVEITNICNLDCTFCKKTKRDLTHMPLSLYENILNEIKPFTDKITLHVLGEPLLHPNFKDIILKTKISGLKINLTTNGTLIDKHKETLLNNSIYQINFSVHSLINNFKKEDLLIHLKNIINFIKTAKLKRPDLICCFRLWNKGIDNSKVLDFISKDFNPNINLTEIINLNKDTKSISLDDNVFIHFDSEFIWPDINSHFESENGYCHALKTHIGILSDGTVIPCCLDVDGLNSLGNIKDASLKQILNSDIAITLKDGFKNRRLISKLCKNCSYIKRLKKNNFA